MIRVMIKISFIIIGYNEGNNIIKCINSIKEMNLRNYEIIYIDSNSNDNTISMLKKYKDVRKYKIESNLYSAALARNIGSQYANGEYIFFLDGDMEISKESDIKFCLEKINTREIGIISGKLREKIYRDNKEIFEITDRYKVKEELEKLRAPGGYFFIKKDILISSGNFNISIKNNEEIDLFSRVKKLGYEIYRTNKLECIHNHCLDNESKNYIKRLKKRFYRDFWRVLYSSIKNNYIKEYLSFKTQQKTMRSIIMTLIGIISTIILPINKLLFIFVCIYYLLLFGANRKNLKGVVSKQINNIMTLFSVIFVFEKVNVSYSVEEV